MERMRKVMDTVVGTEGAVRSYRKLKAMKVGTTNIEKRALKIVKQTFRKGASLGVEEGLKSKGFDGKGGVKERGSNEKGDEKVKGDWSDKTEREGRKRRDSEERDKYDMNRDKMNSDKMNRDKTNSNELNEDNINRDKMTKTK